MIKPTAYRPIRSQLQCYFIRRPKYPVCLHFCKVGKYECRYSCVPSDLPRYIAHSTRSSNRLSEHAIGRTIVSADFRKAPETHVAAVAQKKYKSRDSDSKGAGRRLKNSWRGRRGDGKIEEVYAGSFANISMREMFGVELPEPEASEPGKETQRVKRKVVFLLAYLGTNYGGFQMNAEQRTVQAEFELALFRCKLLLPSNFGFPYKYSWSQSGRTDKGVHACALVCGAKIEVLPNQAWDEVMDDLNNCLPGDIRVLDIKRVTLSFCARTARDRVCYQYMIPSFLLQDVNALVTMLENSGIRIVERQMDERFPLYRPLTTEEIAILKPQMETYRASPQQLSMLKQALSAFEGTHSFHNFTKGIKNNAAEAKRYIVSFRMEEPIVFENGTEWIPTQALGQSFLLHQIRKMIWMAVEVARGTAHLSVIERAFSRDVKMPINHAPAEGLFKDMSFYRYYNQRKQETNPTLPDLDWTNEDSDAYQRWKTFRNEVVMKHIVEQEQKEANFLLFVIGQELSENRKCYFDDIGQEHEDCHEVASSKNDETKIDQPKEA